MNTFNITQAAKILGVSVKTLQRWDRTGKLKPHRTPTNRRMYSRDMLVFRNITDEMLSNGSKD